MRRQDFFYELPQNLIAQYPARPRHSARLLVYQKQSMQMTHQKQVLQLLDYLQEHDLLIYNNTKVLPARFFGRKTTGAKLEILVERLLDPQHMLCHIRSSKAPKPGSQIILNENWQLDVLGREGDLFKLAAPVPILDILYAIGHMPLPPYIDRTDEDADQENYQTIFAKELGSVAAPTAGLHFDDYFLEKIAAKKIAMASVTLHVGAGTFQPVRVDELSDHVMHAEWYELDDHVLRAIQKCREHKGRVIAIGTTALRAIESAARDDFTTMRGLTQLFITPGYHFKVIDGLLTNFHLPESTLLMLVSALIGYDACMRVYQEAVAQQYRFFSYGDACLFI